MPDNQVKEHERIDASVDDEVDAAETESDTTDTGNDSADAAESAAKPRTHRVRAAGRIARKSLPALAALLILALAASTGVLGWKYRHERAVDAAGQAAERAATAYAVTLTSVDTNALDADFKAVLDGSTGEFRDTYTKSSTQLRQLLIDHKATGHGVVLQSAVKSASENEVVVLLFVDQTVSNTDMPDPRIDHSRIVMTMQRVDGAWKAAKVDIP